MPPLSEDRWRIVARAVRLVSAHNWPSEVFRVLRHEYPDTLEDTLQRCVADAREIVRSWYDTEAGDDRLRAESVAFYKSVISDESVPVLHRLRAQENLDRLLALHRPRKTLPDGATDLVASFLAEQMERVKEEGGL